MDNQQQQQTVTVDPSQLDGAQPQQAQSPSQSVTVSPNDVTPIAPDSDTSDGFLSSAVKQSPIGGLMGLPGLIRHPIDAITNNVKYEIGAGKKVLGDLSNMGDPSKNPISNTLGTMDKMGGDIAEAIPLIGPAIKEADDQYKAGNVSGAYGSAMGLISNFFLPKMLQLTGKGVGKVASAAGLGKNVANASDLADAAASGISPSEGSVGSGAGRATSWVYQHLKNNPGVSNLTTQVLDKPTNQVALHSGEEIADRIAGADLTNNPTRAGNVIAQALADTDKSASDIYQDSLDNIEQAGARNVNVTVRGAVTKAAQDALDQIQGNRGDFADTFKDAQDRQLAINTLSDFANPSKQGPTGQFVGDKQLPWSGARTLVSDLSSLARKGGTSSGKAAIMQLKGALQDSMAQSLDSAAPGKGLGTMFQNASSNYAKVQGLMADSTVTRLLENKSPQLAAKYLMQGGGLQTNIPNVLKAIAANPYANVTQTMNVLRGGVIHELLDRSTNMSNQTLQVGGDGGFLAKWNKLGDSGQQTLFPDPIQRGAIGRFAKAADNYVEDIPSATAGQIAQGATYQLKIPFVSRGLLNAGIHLSPQTIESLMSKAKGADALADAVSKPVGSLQHKAAIYTIIQMTHADKGDQ